MLGRQKTTVMFSKTTVMFRRHVYFHSPLIILVT